MAKVRQYYAGRASQDMCQEPTLSLATQVNMVIDCPGLREAQDMLDELARKRKPLSAGQRLYLNSIPNWQEILRVPDYMLA